MRRILFLVVLVLGIVPVVIRAQDESFSIGQRVLAAESTQLQTEPDPTSSVVATLAQGDELQITSGPETGPAGDDWWEVQVVGAETAGWLPASSIEPKYHAAPTWTPTPTITIPVDEPGCEGFNQFQLDVQDAFRAAYDTNYGIVTDIVTITALSQSKLTESTQVELQNAYGRMSDYLAILSTELSKLQAPPFATNWQAYQVAVYAFLSDVYADVSQGITTQDAIQARDQRSQDVGALGFQQFAGSENCQTFVAWGQYLNPINGLPPTPFPQRTF
jgi:hypothetical protein